MFRFQSRGAWEQDWARLGVTSLVTSYLLFQVTDGCLAAAASLHPALSPEEVGEGRARTEKLNQESVR